MQKYKIFKKQLNTIKEIAKRSKMKEYVEILNLEIDKKLEELEALELCERLDKTKNDLLDKEFFNDET